jgi:uncharacterized DUF497 family protein
MSRADFEWDQDKDRVNLLKHGVSFAEAQFAFLDPRRIIARDLVHSEREERFFCFGNVHGAILTVRFTYRRSTVRIIGAGYWRRGKAIYEQENVLLK